MCGGSATFRKNTNAIFRRKILGGLVAMNLAISKTSFSDTIPINCS